MISSDDDDDDDDLALGIACSIASLAKCGMQLCIITHTPTFICTNVEQTSWETFAYNKPKFHLLIVPSHPAQPALYGGDGGWQLSIIPRVSSSLHVG